jgi:peroxiredoxin
MNPRALLAASILAAATFAIPPSALPQDGGRGAKGGKGGKEGGKGADAAKEEKAAVLREGDAVKGVSLEFAAGGTLSLEGPRARPLVLVFAGSWSAESVDALRRLGDPKGKFAGKGADLVGVLRDADAAAAKETGKAEKLVVTLAADPKRRAYDRFAGRGLPYTVVVGKDGKVLLSAAGLDDEAVLAKIDPPKAPGGGAAK